MKRLMLLFVAAALTGCGTATAQTPAAGAVAVTVKNDGPGSSIVWIGPGSPPLVQGIGAGGAPTFYSLGANLSVVDGALTASGSMGGGTWGTITGTLSAQTDLQTALNAKLNLSAVSAFGLTLIDDADAAAARTTLGLGTLATQSANIGDYLTSAAAASTYVSLTGSYANPAWITSMDWSKVTGTPTTLSGYGITDTEWIGTVRGENSGGFLVLTSNSVYGAPSGDIVTSSGSDGSSGDALFTGGGGGTIWTYGGTAAGGGGEFGDMAAGGGGGGGIQAYGGDAFTSSGGAWAGGSAGSILTYGGNASEGTAGLGGGSITTHTGGGSINTRGTGSIQLGASGTRTTLVGAAASNWTLTLPTGPGTSGQVLTTNGSGTTSWATASGGIADPGANGIVVRTALNTTTARAVAAGTNVSVTNGNGVSGNPTINVADATTLTKGVVQLAASGDSTAGYAVQASDTRLHSALRVTDTSTVNLTLISGDQNLQADVLTQQSITSDASGLKLSGDAASPGNSRYYGTDAGGAKGYHLLPAGTGTVTSVAVAGTDGLEVDSGSPITNAGTITLGVNASALKTHLALGNVENTALSTWAGSANLTTLGTITSGTWQGTNIDWTRVSKTGSSLADLATRSAGDLTSGTLDAARLPAPTTTTLGGVKRNTGAAGEFVTGFDTDGTVTYATPSGGSGVKHVVLSSDVTIEINSSLQNITGLAFSAEANTHYEFRVYGVIVTSAAGAGYEFGITGPSSPTFWEVEGNAYNGTAGANNPGMLNSISGSYGTVCLNANGSVVGTQVTARGVFQNGSTAGTVQFTSKVETAVTGSVTFKAGSRVTYWITTAP